MSTSHRDRWTALNNPSAVRDAADRLRQMASTRAEGKARERWLTLFAPRPGERILDAGAGTGDLAVALAAHTRPGGTVHALDLSPGLLQYARELAGMMGVSDHIRTDAGDIRSMPYPDHTFDGAVCRWVLLHLPDPLSAVTEMCRVVRPGGRLLCVEVDWGSLMVRPGNPATMRRIVRANVERQVHGRMGGQLLRLLQSAGLQQVSAYPVVNRDTTGDWLPFLHSRLAVAAAADIPETELTAWWTAIQAGVHSGDYRFSFTQYAVTAVTKE